MVKSNAMRVLQVIDGLPPEQSAGAEQFCLQLSDWLVSQGVELEIAAPSPRQLEAVRHHLPLQRVRSKLLRKIYFDLYSPVNARRLSAIMADFQPDVAHFHNVLGISSQIVRVASRRCATVVTLHGYGLAELFNPMLRHGRMRFPKKRSLMLPWLWVYRAVHRRHLAGATLVSPSRYVARYFEQLGYGNVRVIPNGVHLPEEVTTAEPRMLFVGRLTPEKGLQQVLQPLEAVARELGWQIDVVGDGPLRARLEHAFPVVRFHGWADPAPFYRQAGIVVMPSLWPENLGYVVLEAMSYQVPVLASNVGGIPEIVDDGITGRLYNPDDSEQFVSALRALAGDAALRERLGRAARQRIAQDFTWASIGPRYLALYEELSPAGALSVANVPVS